MKALSFDQSIQITDELAYINIPISILQYCMKNVSRSAMALWMELRDITKYKNRWKTVITNKRLGERIGRSAHTAYVLVRQLVKKGLLEKVQNFGQACTLMLRYPESLLQYPVLKSATPFKNKGGNKDYSLYNNNNYVNNKICEEEERMKDPDKWPSIKENCLKCIQNTQEDIKVLKNEQKIEFGVKEGESTKQYYDRILNLSYEIRLKNQEQHLKITKLEEYLNSVFVELHRVNELLKEGKDAFLKRTSKVSVKKSFQPYNPVRKYNNYSVVKKPNNKYTGFQKYTPEYD